MLLNFMRIRYLIWFTLMLLIGCAQTKENSAEQDLTETWTVVDSVDLVTTVSTDDGGFWLAGVQFRKTHAPTETIWVLSQSPSDLDGFTANDIVEISGIETAEMSEFDGYWFRDLRIEKGKD